MKSVDDAYAAAMAKLPTPKLTRALQAAVVSSSSRRAPATAVRSCATPTRAASNPPRIIIHGTALEHVPDSYRRYLERFFREAFKLQGTPLRSRVQKRRAILTLRRARLRDG